MADDYRHKFLELEKDYIFLKNNHDYELQRAKLQVDEVERRYNEKLTFELGEAERRLREVAGQKDGQISEMQRELMESDLKI
jgi:hypothetical protein